MTLKLAQRLVVKLARVLIPEVKRSEELAKRAGELQTESRDHLTTLK